MAIPNYERPSLQIFQDLEVIDLSAAERMAACVVGMQYDLYRYGTEITEGVTYTGTSTSITLQSHGCPVDNSSVTLYAKDLQISIVASAPYTPLENPTVVTAATAEAIASVEVGDIFTAGTYVTTVISKSENHLRLASCPYDISVAAADSITATITRKKSGWIKAVDNGVNNFTISGSVVSVAFTVDTDTGKQYITGKGKLYPNYRALVRPLITDEVVRLTSIADIQTAFGTIEPENDIAYGAYCALVGSNFRPVYAVAAVNDTEASFIEAINKTEANSACYTFVPLTDKVEVIKAVSQHTFDSSNPVDKRWRRTVAGVDVPSGYTAISSSVFKGVIVSKNLTTILQLKDSKGNTFETVAHTIVPGDKVVLTGSSQSFTVRKVLSATELELMSGPIPDITTATAFSVTKVDSFDNVKAYLSELASSLATRRTVLVWSDTPQGTTGTVKNKFVAAEVAGMSSNALPQQPLTRSELSLVKAAPKMYTKYTQGQLDQIAAEGVCIIAQNSKNAPIYIRHQLTTETDKGNLYFEDSCTRNVDNISYAVDKAIDKYVGKVNVVASAVNVIYQDIFDTLTAFTKDTQDKLIGPSLVLFDKLSIAQDPTFKDRLVVNYRLHIPLPLNGIKIYEEVVVADLNI